MNPFKTPYQADHTDGISTARTEIKPSRSFLDKNWFSKILSYKCVIKGKGVRIRA